MKTIYQLAGEAMDAEIESYLSLVDATNGLTTIDADLFSDNKLADMFAAGIGSQVDDTQVDVGGYLVREFQRKSAVDFDVESAVCVGVYNRIRPFSLLLFREARDLTNEFSFFEAEKIKLNSHLLPVFQNALGMSKSQLKKLVGSVSDVAISGPAAIRLADLLSARLSKAVVSEENVLQRMEITLEGIVRDLVGRVLFEDVVAHALQNEGVDFLREDEYPAISGVIYDFRADFVLPNHTAPLAFIEVRKSSSRHASLYAKDKMFSAINWKGQHKGLIGVIVVEGDWTRTTLETMANVFDYVVPLSKVGELAKLLRRAQDGDESILRWLINFSISSAPGFAKDSLPPLQ